MLQHYEKWSVARSARVKQVKHRTYWGGPLWRDRFLLWFLDPKLVPTKITFFPFLEGAKSWENQ